MKRAIAMLLAMLFVLTLIPVSALAASPEDPHVTKTFTITMKDMTSKSLLSPSQVTFTRELSYTQDASGNPVAYTLLGASEHVFDLPKKAGKNVISVSSTAPAGFYTSFAVDSDTNKATVTLNTADDAIAAADLNNALKMTIELNFGDPVIHFSDSLITNVSYPNKGVVSTGESVPAGSLVTMTLDPSEIPAGAKLMGFTDVSATIAADEKSATFSMPTKDVTLTPKYAYKVTVETSQGTKLDEQYVLNTATDAVTLAAAEPADEIFDNTSWTSTDGSVSYDTTGKSVIYTPSGALTGAVTISVTSEKLYLINTADCTVVTPEDGSGDRKGMYVVPGTSVTVEATKQAASYSWLQDNVPASGNERTFTFIMPTQTTSIAVADQYLLTQYAPDGTTVEKTEYYIAGASVTATAPATNAAGYKFAHWKIESIATEVLASDLTRNPITFSMPAAGVKLVPEYLTSLTITDATFTYTKQYSGDPDPVKHESKTVNGSTVETWYVAAGTLVTLNPAAPNSDGTYKFSYWASNYSLLNSSTYNTLSFPMPAEDVVVQVGWQSYTLTVKRFVDQSIVESYSLRPGETIKLDAQQATGGTAFNYWSTSYAMRFIVNGVETELKEPTTSSITVVMGAGNATITAIYGPSSAIDYIYTGAKIAMINEPVRYYAKLEYFRTDELVVYYYPNGGGEGQRVDNSQLVCRVVYPGTSTLATAADGCFIGTGDFELQITFYVNGKKMADTITVLNTLDTFIHCSETRPEYVASIRPKMNKTVYFENESVSSISKDGLKATAIQADHTTDINAAVTYASMYDLSDEMFNLVLYNTEELSDLTKLPTVAQIDDAVTRGIKGFKKTTDKDGTEHYYVQLGLEAYDQNQLKSDGTYTQLMYIINNTEDEIWVEIKKGATGLDLENFNPSTEVESVSSGAATYPTYSWTVPYSTLVAERTFDLAVAGITDPKLAASSIGYTNENTKVAAVSVPDETNKPLRFKLTPRAVGATVFTFYVRGDETQKVTLEVTVIDDVGGIIPITYMDSLNRSTASLYVGNKLTLYPAVYSPNNADTTCDWSVDFDDGLEPHNAQFYVKVDPVTGVVEVLQYTDRVVRVTATAVNQAGSGPFTASCLITVVNVPVTRMTMDTADLAMFRLASKQLSATLYPTAATDQKINWTSSDSSVVSVDTEGRITANKLGNATITATANGNTNVYKSVKITVWKSVLLTELALSSNNATLGVGDSTNLSVYYTPATATTKAVTWSSSDVSVATVDQNGKVRGVAEGGAIIYATADDGSGIADACAVTVTTIVASAVVLNKQTLAMIEDDKEELIALIYPTNASNTGVKWSSSNEKVAIVDAQGEITAVGGGSAVITATSKDASSRYADCVVVVTAKVPVTAISLNLPSFDLLVNDTTLLVPTVAPANATGKVTYASSDAKIASVDEKGKISGLSTGSAVITVKAGDKSAAITVNVVTKMFSVGKVVNCSRRVNVRSAASGTSSVVGFAYLGSEYRVLDQSGNWYKIQYNATTTAYIWSRYLAATQGTAQYTSAGTVGTTTVTPAPGTTATPVPVVSKTVTITNCAYCVNVRSGAGTTFTKLGYAYLDESFVYTGVSDGWYAVEYKGVTGYISSQFVKVNG